MHVKYVELTNFRNYTRLSLDLKPGVVIVQGDNAQGKTNFLEAIYLLAVGKSPFAGSDRELVNWLALGEPIPFARIEARVADGEEEHLIEVVITAEKGGPQGWRFRKRVRINGVNKKLAELPGHLRAVLFSPDDVHIVSGSPELRRRFLDIALCQVNPRYCRTLALYHKIVEGRNHLLKKATSGSLKPEELVFWDEGLIKHGTLITVARWEALASISHWLQRIHRELTGGQEIVQTAYVPSALGEPVSYARLIRSAPVDEIQKRFESRLEASRPRELEQGITLVGPHRDDVRFLLNGRDVGVFGSRGQRRSVALSLRLAEMEFISAHSGSAPVLLLDEVMSELDSWRREHLMKLVSKVQQVIITTVDWGSFERSFMRKAQLLTVHQGIVKEISSP